MHSIELLPDGATDRAVRGVWRSLADEGLPSQSAHRHPTNRPHLTLATAETFPAETRTALAESLAALPLTGLLRFSGRVNVLAWAVRPDAALLELHETVWRILREAPGGGGRSNPLLSPARWVPHITLGRGRGAVWPGPDGRWLPEEATGPGVLPGRWAGARSYDSTSRTTAGIGPGTP
ncbi:2'-5' RNA ligase family protein [Streptomyces sp. CS7]|uniref:2'-5' RNA ligase family protein n=1 Tax=Streptomyces sp. CS-7 TaxID=2906769 RepID=UPI0021B2D1BE|nr:2'-5' RNA ligase family protein [Streptomyces sp. CS-7]MCT6778875.1 2'-5' RNA ligase family protein [Streptomyces sp. CS-7]